MNNQTQVCTTDGKVLTDNYLFINGQAYCNFGCFNASIKADVQRLEHSDNEIFELRKEIALLQSRVTILEGEHNGD